MNLDDPNLTAYALGELNGAENEKWERAVAESPEAAQSVAATREIARLLKHDYDFERRVQETAPTNVIAMSQPDVSTPSIRYALAAALALFAVIGAVAIATFKSGPVAGESGRFARVEQPGKKSSPAEVNVEPVETETAAAPAETPASNYASSQPAVTQPMFREEDRMSDKEMSALSGGVTNKSKRSSLSAPAPRAMGFASAGTAQPLPLSTDALRRRDRDDFNTATYDHVEENPFLSAATNPLSTFSVDVDTASYANVRRFISNGSLPPKDAVRIEEMVNYFSYDYPQPEENQPFSINLEGASCPWAPDHRLVRIGLKGREIANEKRGASNLVFLLDVSGSMNPAERLPLIKQSMRLLVDKLTENDRVAIVVYAGASGLALPSTRGDQKEKILSALEELQAGGSTNGAEGIELAYKIAADNFIKGGVNRLILATDGDFNVGVTNQGDLIRLVQEKAKHGVFLSVLGVGTDNYKDSTMQKLADKGNGNYAYLDSLDEARKVLVQQMNGTLVTIAKDVKIQVEFNPAHVASYRLIGYEKRLLRKEDFNNDKIDAGEIGAGHTVTALYEIVPAGSDAPNPAASIPAVDALKYQAPVTTTDAKGSPEWLTIKLRGKKPDGDTSELTQHSWTDNGAKFDDASPDLKFAAAVAEFGMILRDSPHKGIANYVAVTKWAEQGKGRDQFGYRAGFLELVHKSAALALGGD